MPSPKVKVILIGGTLAVKWPALPYYLLLAWRLGAKLMFLPHGGTRPIEETYQELAAQIDAYVGDDPVILAGHSQGGLMAARYLVDHPETVEAIALSAPFHGSLLCYLARPISWILPGFLPAAKDMSPNSPFLKDLRRRLAESAVAQRLISIYSRGDGIVIPAISSHVDGATNIELPWYYNHISEVLAFDVLEQIAQAKHMGIDTHRAALKLVAA
jgi:pimeloyl-ACP methyl ester carboxylesterase